MQLDSNDLRAIAKALDPDGRLGVAEAAEKDSSIPERQCDRGLLWDLLAGGYQGLQYLMVTKFVMSEANALLLEIEETTSDPAEVLRRFGNALRERYLDPLKANKGKAQVLLDAIVQHVKTKLGL